MDITEEESVQSERPQNQAGPHQAMEGMGMGSSGSRQVQWCAAQSELQTGVHASENSVRFGDNRNKQDCWVCGRATGLWFKSSAVSF